MILEGSCHCGAVSFSVDSRTPYPFNYCYCTVCRKTTGAGGYAINLMGDAPSLRVEGGHDLSIYQATIDGETSTAMRYFCRRCGSHLWLWDPRWPELIHPLAAAIDSELPATPERVHLMLASRPSWCPVPEASPQERHFDLRPEESIEGWHHKRNLLRP